MIELARTDNKFPPISVFFLRYQKVFVKLADLNVDGMDNKYF